MKPRRLWIFNHHAATRDQGTGTRHLDLASRLARRGVSVTIFAAGFNHFSGREERLSRRQLLRSEVVDHVEFVWLRTVPYRRNDIWRMLNMASYFAMAVIAQLGRERPTHVIGSTVHPLAALAGWLVARMRRARFYFEIRDLWPQTLIDIGAIREGSVATRALRRLERFLVEHAHAVITVLPAIEDYFGERGLRPRALTYIPNGVAAIPPQAGAGSGSEALRRIASYRSQGRFVAVYTGAHAIHNRLEVVIEAARLLEEAGDHHIAIVLVGDGPAKADLVSRAEGLGLSNITFAPPVPKDEVGRILTASDACILHMTRTPVYRFGVSFNKLFDYLASRRPIVFACETTYDPVQRAVAGISIPPDDPKAMREALSQLAETSQAERDAMGERGNRYVAEHHDLDRLAGDLFAALSA